MCSGRRTRSLVSFQAVADRRLDRSAAAHPGQLLCHPPAWRCAESPNLPVLAASGRCVTRDCTRHRAPRGPGESESAGAPLLPLHDSPR